MKEKIVVLGASAAIACGAVDALAQSAADTRPLQENGPPALRPPQPSRSPLPEVQRPAPAAAPAAAPSAGPSALINSITLNGNSVFSKEELAAVLGPASGKRYNFAALAALVDQINDMYHKAGYPFARAYLPPQNLGTGQLRIDVLEGRYGSIAAAGYAPFVADAESFLSALKPGEIMNSRKLERVSLILDDQPGIRTRPVIRPGTEVGTGDLVVQVDRDHRYSGEAGLDNHGSRFMGRDRLHANLDVDSTFWLGDQMSVQGLYTETHMWFGSMNFSTPIGHSGLRGRIGYSHSFYELNSDFTALKATGTADVLSAGVTYPLVRQQAHNVTLNAAGEYKKLHDSQGTVATETHKRSQNVRVGASFDQRDQAFGGPGVTFGSAAYTFGRLDLPEELQATDALTANTRGSFGKLTVDAARIQSLTGSVDFYVRGSVQRATKNLDSSEKFGLGGINGVRAYPSGEGYGDDGWLVQSELRYAIGGFVPYLFYDAGSVRINKHPWQDIPNDRSIAGVGIGVRFVRGNWNGNIAFAHRTKGGESQSDKQQGANILLANAEYRF